MRNSRLRALPWPSQNPPTSERSSCQHSACHRVCVCVWGICWSKRALQDMCLARSLVANSDPREAFFLSLCPLVGLAPPMSFIYLLVCLFFIQWPLGLWPWFLTNQAAWFSVWDAPNHPWCLWLSRPCGVREEYRDGTILGVYLPLALYSWPYLIYQPPT